MTSLPSSIRTLALAAGLLLHAGAAVAATDAVAPGATVTATTTAESPATAAKALIARVLPAHADRFVCEVIPAAADGKDVFEIEAVGGKIVLRGNNGVSLAMAFNRYLRDTALINFDWYAAKPLEFKGELPAPAAKQRAVCAARERFFLNYCTYGYTMPWWGPGQWTRFIDWMAMNGVNRPLMQAGTEAVWMEVWKSYGMTEDQCRTYFGGPAHLPWHRMANHDKWGGPLPMSYITGQMKLQKDIMAQARGLGMKPVLSGFAGHVPEAFKALKPDGHYHRIPPGWGGMPKEHSTWFLDPADPLFVEIQKKFLHKQAEMYGTDHCYGADPFNEMTPPSWEPEYLAKVAKTIYESMAAADPQAVWYQMSWTFYFDKNWTPPRLEAMTKAVPTGKLVYLDYVCEETEFYPKSKNFHGAPFIWNYLANFGGNTHVVAPINKMSKRISAALTVPNCAGVGSTLEGLNINPVAYDLLLEQPWHANGTVDLERWVENYAARRAGRRDAAVEAAWKQLASKVLVDNAMGIWGHASALQGKPNYDKPLDMHWTLNTHIAYKPAELVKAVDLLLQAAPESRTADGYRFDVMNFTRQALSNHALAIHTRMFAAIKAKDIASFRRDAARFIELGNDLDTLLATRHEFLLGSWIADARSWGVNDAEKAYYEQNAREIISTWHKPGASLTDYSHRQWNGMFGTYYLARWKEFFKRVDASMTAGTPFDQADFRKWCTEFEGKWNHASGENFPATPQGDPVETAERLFKKYKDEMLGAAPAAPTEAEAARPAGC